MRYFLLTVLMALFSIQGMADEKVVPFTAEQKTEIEKIIHEYMVHNPEILMEASKALQERLLDKALKENAKDIFTNPKDPMLGDLHAKVQLVSFFDYQCSHCKDMSTIIANLMKKNPNVRFIFKEFPIFGDDSVFASKVALCAYQQGKYQAFHEAAMGYQKKLDQKAVYDVAKQAGLDQSALKKALEDKTLTTTLQGNLELGEALRIGGTPAFIVGCYPDETKKSIMMGGAISEEVLQAAITSVCK